MTTPTPQPAIFALGTRYQHHLELDVDAGVTAEAVVGALRTGLEAPHVSGGGTNLVIGFGSEMWQRLSPDGPPPGGIGPFVEVVGRDGHIAPATQHDIWFWTHGSGVDAVLDTAVAITAALDGVAVVAQEVPCFVYHDSRDLTGFIDGTANPPPIEAPQVACIPAGSPGAGGSHVLTQRWVHDLAAFETLEVADQERVFGRTKLDSVALPKNIRPSNAHITLAEIHDDQGEEREVYRRSTPYGDVEERGLYFLAFSAERDRFDEMFAQIYGTDGRPERDRLLDFTKAVSGAYYFAPSVDDLLALGIGSD